VRGKHRKWRIDWGAYGDLNDRAYSANLKRCVWRHPLWAPPFEQGMEQETVTCGIDLSFASDTKGKRPSQSEMRGALKTQLEERYTHQNQESVVCGVELSGPDGSLHLVGAMGVAATIRASYDIWRRQIGVLFPHIGSNAVALANAYWALCPDDARSDGRMLVLDGRHKTHVLLMDQWRLIDSIEYRMVHDQKLDDNLLRHWEQFFVEHHLGLSNLAAPCVLSKGGRAVSEDDLKTWSPVDTLAAYAQGVAKDLIETYPDLAVLAFGMALQGG
jgi:hypothetical protein